MLLSRAILRPLALTVAPLPSLDGLPTQNAAAILFIHDPERQARVPVDVLRRSYGLTAAEARLAMILVEGQSLKEAADRCGVTHNTVRSQLKNIFIKTGVKRQGELIRFLLGHSDLIRQA